MPWPKLIAYNAKQNPNPQSESAKFPLKNEKRQRISIFNITKKRKKEKRNGIKGSPLLSENS